MQSPVVKLPTSHRQNHAIFFLKRSYFEEIEDFGQDGCGFICEKFLIQLLGGTEDVRKSALAIQVRIIIPSLGIFKGMLCRKKMTNEAKFQLPTSMKKVGASKKSDRIEDEACLLINRIHSNSTNQAIGRILDPALPNPTSSFYQDLKRKKLSPMFI